MSEDKREQLRARVQATSKDEVVLDEMVRRGFWREDAAEPSLPAELIKRQAEVRRELQELARDAAAYADPERALKLVQAERMKVARERRLETKRRRASRRHQRAIAWHERQGREIAHLGESVSFGLAKGDNKPDRSAALKVPPIADAAALAAAMGIKIAELRFLSYHRQAAKVDHYKRFTIPKKTGGVREIAAPMPRLKRAQYWILQNILTPLQVHEAAHGFRVGRSILTNARPHTGRRVVVNIDLKDFFPTLTYVRVLGFFTSLGYPGKVAAPLALICTDAERDELSIDGQTWKIARAERRLPQGAPTSPAIANLIANRMDKRMQGAAKALGFVYTRYADDMTFSGDAAPGSDVVARLLWQLRAIAEDEGFAFNDSKTRVMGAGARQDVTGLVVNQKPAVPRCERRRFRAWLHRAEAARTSGAPPPPWTNAKGAQSDAMGFASYLAMIDRDKGAVLVARTSAVFAAPVSSARKAAGAEATGINARAAFRAAAGAGRAPADKWWVPADRPAPQLEVLAVDKAAATRSASSVPQIPIGGANPAGSARRSPWGTEAPSSQPDAAAGGPTLLVSITRSLFLLVVLAIPGLGPLLLIAGLMWIWSAYRRGRRGGR